MLSKWERCKCKLRDKWEVIVFLTVMGVGTLAVYVLYKLGWDVLDVDEKKVK